MPTIAEMPSAWLIGSEAEDSGPGEGSIMSKAANSLSVGEN